MLGDTQQLVQSKVLVIGDSCQDHYIFGECTRLSPEAPVPILLTKRREIRPGMALNVASNLENLGNSVSVVTQKQEILKTRYVSEPSLTHLLRVDDESEITSLTFYEIQQLKFSNFSAVVVSDYDKGFISRDAAKQISQQCSKNNVPLFVDSKKSDLSCYSDVVLKVNNYEKQLIKKFPRNASLIETLGANGARYKNKTYPAYEPNVKDLNRRDVSGAGDTFVAGLVHYFVNVEPSISAAIPFANMCAGVVVEKFGTMQISNDLLKGEEDE